jgi:hypothetical protein
MHVCGGGRRGGQQGDHSTGKIEEGDRLKRAVKAL